MIVSNAINSNLNTQHTSSNIGFGVIKPKHIFINMDGFDKDINWANTVCRTIEKATRKIKRKAGFNNVLSYIEKNYGQYFKKANIADEFHNNIDNAYVGVRRIKNGKLTGGLNQWIIEKSRYSPYLSKFKDFLKDRGKIKPFYWNPFNHPEPLKTRVYNISARGISLGKIALLEDTLPKVATEKFGEGTKLKIEILHQCDLKSAMAHIKKVYKELLAAKKNKNLDEINSKIAEIHWFFANAMPEHRGSAGIGDALTKALYEAMDVQVSPWKKGVAPDLEAFTHTLDGFIKDYPALFEKAPKFMPKKKDNIIQKLMKKFIPNPKN